MDWYVFLNVLAWPILFLGLGMALAGIFNKGHIGWLLYFGGIVIALVPFAYLVARP